MNRYSYFVSNLPHYYNLVRKGYHIAGAAGAALYRYKKAYDNPDPDPSSGIPLNITNRSMAYRRPVIGRFIRRSRAVGRTVRRGKRIVARRLRRQRRRFRRRPWLTPHLTVAPRKFVKMKYVMAHSNSGGFTQTADTLFFLPVSHQAKANSPWRPNGGYGGGGRLDQNASQYAYYSTLYRQYSVKYSKFKLTWRQGATSTAYSVPMIMGVVLNQDTTPTIDSYEQLSARLNSKYKIVHIGNDKRQASVKMKFKGSKRFGSGASVENVASIDADPNTVVWYCPFLQLLDSASTAIAANHMIMSVTYYCVFDERKEIHDMPAAMALEQT